MATGMPKVRLLWWRGLLLRAWRAAVVSYGILFGVSTAFGSQGARTITALRPELSLRQVERLFKNPPNDFRITQYQLNAGALKKYPQYGIGGYMAFFYKDLYRHGPGGARKIAPLIAAARKSGRKVWLADDWGYPSGMAGGRVVEQHPEFELRSLVMVKQTGAGRTPISFALPGDLEDIVCAVLYPLARREGNKGDTPDYARARVLGATGRKISATGIDGKWQLSVFARFLRNKNTQAQSTMQQFKHTGRFPDLMNDKAVASFIRNMHAPVMAQVRYPKGVVQGFYCNEPNLMQTCWQRPGPYACLPWTAALPKTFKSMHGYELTPFLAACFEGNDITSRRTRLHFRQTVAELFSTSFGRQIAEWCEKRGIRSSGHFLLNGYLSQHVVGYGDMMKFVSEFHVPALDIPIPNPNQYDSFPYEQTKFFSSVAIWKKRPDTIMLHDPIIGGYGMKRLSPGLPLLINAVNNAFYQGATIFTSYLPLDRNKAGTAAGYKVEDFRFLNEYIGRLGMLIRGARPASQVALYYPIAMFQADVLPSRQRWPQVVGLHREKKKAWDETQRALRRAGIEYTIVHPEAVAQASVRNGAFTVGDARLKYLIVPHMEFIPLEVLKTIKKLEEGRGTVIWVGSVPDKADRAADTDDVRRMTDGYKAVSIQHLAGLIKNPYPPEVDLQFLNEPNELLVGRFLRGKTPVYLLVNKTEGRIQARIKRETGGPAKVKVYDPSTATIRSSSTGGPIVIEGHRSLVIIE